jgi:hypothetical protein
MRNQRSICGAKTRSGGKCKSLPMENGRCRMHGGKTPKGPKAPSWKHGRYSQYLPTQLVPLMSAALSDPEMLSLRSEIGLVTAQIEERLRAVSDGSAGGNWKALQDEYQLWLRSAQEAQASEKAGDKLGAARSTRVASEAAATIGKLIEAGTADQSRWADVRALIDQRRKLVESERKRLVESQQVVALNQVQIILDALIRTIKEAVTDDATILQIESGFVRTLGGTGFLPADRGD